MICKQCEFLEIENEGTRPYHTSDGPKYGCFCKHPKAKKFFREMCVDQTRPLCFVCFTPPMERYPRLKTAPIWCPRNRPADKRPFTEVSDMLILEMLVEDNASAREISEMLDRDQEDVAKRIRYLKKSEKLRGIHEKLMAYNGYYARKFLKKAGTYGKK